MSTSGSLKTAVPMLGFLLIHHLQDLNTTLQKPSQTTLTYSSSSLARRVGHCCLTCALVTTVPELSKPTHAVQNSSTEWARPLHIRARAELTSLLLVLRTSCRLRRPVCFANFCSLRELLFASQTVSACCTCSSCTGDFIFLLE